MKKLLFVVLLIAMSYLMWGQNSPITVTSPNGGEIWAIGTIHNITWTVMNVTGNVSIQLRRGAGNQEYLTLAQSVPATQGIFAWRIPSTVLPGSEYKIRVAQMSNSGVSLMDYSDAYFTISGNTNPTPSLTVLTPNGGENWQIGTIHDITWTSANLTGNVRIELQSPAANAVPIVIATEVPVTQGVFHWTIPNTIVPAASYRVNIVSLSMLTVYIADNSDADFTISTQTGTPSLTVVTPNGGENWELGSTHPITWTSTNLTGNVRIELITPLANPIAIIIAQSIPVTQGIFHWTIPNTLPAASYYQVMICSLENNTGNILISDVSDGCFTLSEQTVTPSITVLSPNGGEIWTRGNTYPVNWSFANLSGNVSIQLIGMNSTAPVLTIAQSVPVQSGHFEWTIPSTCPIGNQYKVRICAVTAAGLSIMDMSDGVFAITEGNTPPPQSSITVTSPNGGEVWTSGQTYNITWNSTNLNGPVAIMLVRGNNISNPVLVITRETPNTGIFSWTIPIRILPGHRFKIFIFSRNNTSIRDISDGTFAIIESSIQLRTVNHSNETIIKVQTSNSDPITLRIYDVKGKLIRTLINNKILKEENIIWDRKDNLGRNVSKGVYLLQLESRSQYLAKQICLIK